MGIPRIARRIMKTFLGRHAVHYVRRLGRRTVPQPDWYSSSFADRRGFEIGGPSAIFTDQGSVPVYATLESLDNCLFSHHTIWEGEVAAGHCFNYHPDKPCGLQYILEATELHAVHDSHYDCVLSSHTLEHIANPLRALREWKRILKNEGLLLLVLPHKDGTFDWRRPTTTLQHMIADFDHRIGEDDLSHLPEILALHDLNKDKAAGSPERFRSRCLQNFLYRAVHHHVFDTPTAVAILDHAGFHIVRVDLLKPHHIILVARRSARIADNSAFLAANAAYKRRSPFPSDHRRDSF